MLPENIQSQVCKNQDIHSYDTRNKDKVFVSSVNTILKQMSTNIKGVKMWNELDSNIRDSISFNFLKRKLKQEYIRNY